MIYATPIKHALGKALLASILFIITYMFYNTELIRSNIEDLAFDIVNKFSINTRPIETNGPQVLLFSIDDLYMKEHKLYDEHNRSRYGYLFPRGQIAKFIENVDDLSKDVDTDNLPKALFIDYDMSFTSMPYGKELSGEDIKLLEVLKRPRPYKIVLPKTSFYNFIEESQDKDIQKAIEEKRILFVSVSLLLGSDDIVRRYQSYKQFSETNDSKVYTGVGIALWKIIREDKIDYNNTQILFSKDDIIGNRIWLKSYSQFHLENNCSIQNSYWTNLTKYSANCSLFNIIEEDFSNSILMLGGTHTQNDDNFDILNVMNSESFSGIDKHANTLMTLLHLNGNMQRLGLWVSLLIVFLSFFTLSLLITYIFSFFDIFKSELEFIILLLINTIVLISISVILLNYYNVWFNWFIPLILFELIEVFTHLKNFTQKIILKIKEIKWGK